MHSGTFLNILHVFWNILEHSACILHAFWNILDHFTEYKYVPRAYSPEYKCVPRAGSLWYIVLLKALSTNMSLRSLSKVSEYKYVPRAGGPEYKCVLGHCVD